MVPLLERERAAAVRRRRRPRDGVRHGRRRGAAGDVRRGPGADLARLARAFPRRLGYYAKGIAEAHLEASGWPAGAPWAGLGFDWQWDLAARLTAARSRRLRAGEFRRRRSCSRPAARSTRRSTRSPRPCGGSIPRRGAAGFAASATACCRRRPRPACARSSIACGRHSYDHFDDGSVRQVRRAGAALHELSDRAAVARRCRRPTTGSRRSARRSRARRDALALRAPAVLRVAVHVLRLQHRNHARPRPRAAVHRRSSCASSTRISSACRRSPIATVDQLHLGGGTPTFSPPDALGELVDGLLARLPRRAAQFRGIGRGRPARHDARAPRRAARPGLHAALARHPGFQRRDAAPGQPHPDAGARRGARRRRARRGLRVDQLRPDLRPARADARVDARDGRRGAGARARSARRLQLRARAVDQTAAAQVPRRPDPGRRREARALRDRARAAPRRRLRRARPRSLRQAGRRPRARGRGRDDAPQLPGLHGAPHDGRCSASA